jgi:tRNA modification GTPase
VVSIAVSEDTRFDSDGDRRDTIAAIATPAGRGAVAIVRVSGPAARTVARCVFRSRRALRPRVATFGAIVDQRGERIDEGLALWFEGPHSYTGEDVLELHVHGSPAVARDTLIATLAGGARIAGPGEFTRRAFLAGKMDLSAAEAVADLIAAEHRSAAQSALARLSGGLAHEVDGARSQIAAVLEELAAAIDFPDEVEDPQRSRLAERLRAIEQQLAGLAATWERGRLVREGAGVAIVGPPNAGKSSLLNALLGADRVLVSELAGTTRDTVEELLALEGCCARLIDTAGLRRASDRLEVAGVARAEAALDTARIALVVVDGSRSLDADANAVLERTRARQRLVLFNKRDLGCRGYDERDPAERDALFGSVFDAATLERLRAALTALIAGGEQIDVARPHLGTARQFDAVLRAWRALELALETLDAGDPVDLIAGDLTVAFASLGELSGSAANEALLDAIFARFCIGK